MSTFNQLAERVDTLLHGYAIATEATTWLTTSATSTSTTLTLHDVGVLGRGFIQIGDEVLYVHSIDPANSQVTISPWGRGQRGTTATAHTANVKVTVAPLFPRNEIKRAINDTINAMYPNIFGVGQTEFTYIANRTTYDLPDSAEQILNITHETIGPSKEWLPVRAYNFDRMANPTAFGTAGELGKSVSVLSPIMPGRKVNVAYGKRPTVFTDGDQEFSTWTGLPNYAEDVVIYGAAFRMVSFIDPSRLAPQSASADALDMQQGARTGESTSRFLFNVYQQRLNEVAENQRRQYPTRSHYQR
jgi:hypothetical protein